MPKFRKKPVVIEAWQTNQLGGWNLDYLAEWCGGRVVDEGYPAPGIVIQTLEGDMYASPGDWIIKGVNGEFYPCKPDVFEKTYEPVMEVG